MRRRGGKGPAWRLRSPGGAADGSQGGSAAQPLGHARRVKAIGAPEGAAANRLPPPGLQQLRASSRGFALAGARSPPGYRRPPRRGSGPYSSPNGTGTSAGAPTSGASSGRGGSDRG